MALTPTVRVTTFNATDALDPTVTSASFTPSNNSLLVAIITTQNATGGDCIAGVATVAPSGGGLTWTRRAAASTAASLVVNAGVWTAPVTTGASMTVATSASGVKSQGFVSLTVIEFTGYDTATPTGVTLGTSTGSRSGAYSPALSGTSASDSYVVVGGIADAGTATKGSSWTQAHDFSAISGGTDGEGNIEYITGAQTAANWAALDSSFSTAVAGIEIKAAATAVADNRPLGTMLNVSGY